MDLSLFSLRGTQYEYLVEHPYDLVSFEDITMDKRALTLLDIEDQSAAIVAQSLLGQVFESKEKHLSQYNYNMDSKRQELIAYCSFDGMNCLR